jgi:DNA-binding transcriptional LysR family regulator
MVDEPDLNDIRRLDGALLLVFRALLLERRSTVVARRLNLSQSAVSHALGRLRDLFGDPLFIRRPHGLEPTQRALELGPKIEALIALAGDALASPTRFDPGRSSRRFRIAAPGFITSTIGGDLVSSFLREAPGAVFIARALLVDVAVAALRRGEVDLALGQFTRIPPDLVAEALYADRYCVIARRGHPTIDGRIDQETYARTPHVFVGDPLAAASSGAVHDPAQMASAYGDLPDPAFVWPAAYVPQWETAMLMVAASDAIAECPGRLARRHAARLGLQILEAPYDAAMPPVLAVRRADANDPAVDWLLAKVREVVAAQA